MRPSHLLIAVAIASVAGGAVAQPGGGPFGTVPPWNNQILWCDMSALKAALRPCESGLAAEEGFLNHFASGKPEKGEDWDPDDLAEHRAWQRRISLERARCQRIRTAISYLTANPKSVCG